MSNTLDTIAQIKNGDQAAIKTLYLANKKPFMLFAARYQMDEDDLLDIYQDAIIAFCENAKKGKLDHLKSGISTYLFAIGKFMIFKRLKQQVDTVSWDELTVAGIEIEIEENDDDDSQMMVIKDVLKKLGQQCQNVLRLFYYEEKKLDEIQSILNYTNKDVLKAQKSRCLKQLKELIHGKDE